LVDTIPIMSAHSSKAQNVLVFANFTDLLAYDKKGTKWRTERLAYDGFKITQINDVCLSGEYWDIRNETSQMFQVDLASGINLGQKIEL